MATNPFTTAQPSYPDGEHAIREATVAFAVDVSASTRGSVITTEKALISRISKRMSGKSQVLSTILPWSGVSHPPVGLVGVSSLEPQSGTRPVVVLNDVNHLDALSKSSLWLLLTDGRVSEEDRVQFAKRFPATQLHGKPCIAAIVHSQRRHRGPAHFNISVGVPVYAISPNCIYLFCDDKSNDIFILQAKGVFKSLLKGAANPVINMATTWDTLPRLSLDDLVKVIIPPPKNLESGQIALQDSFVINMDDILNNKLSTQAVDQILANDDNLSSVLMTMQTRNQQNAFQDWIVQQATILDDPLYHKREDIEGRAALLYSELLESRSNGESARHLKGLQESLREAHAKNMRIYLHDSQERFRASAKRKSKIRMASARSMASHIDDASSLSATGNYRYTGEYDGDDSEDDDEYNLNIFASRPLDHTTSAHTAPERVAPSGMSAEPIPRYYAAMAETWLSWVHQITNPELLDLLYTPGFRCKTGSFTGTCPICGGKDRNLAWLFRGPPPNAILRATLHFPAPNSVSSLAFPLAMGFFIETDVVCTSICCDSCSWCAVTISKAPGEASPVVAALPMVRYTENAAVYSQLLFQLFAGRFSEPDLTQVFMSALYNTTMQLDTSAESGSLFRDAFQWTFADLLDTAEIPTQLINVSSDPQSASIQHSLPMCDMLPDAFRADDISPYLVKYPLHGFLVLLHAARTWDIPPAALQLAVFQRFLFALVEGYTENQSVAAATDVLRRLLWTTEWMTQSEQRENPRFAVPVTELRGTALLRETTGAMLDGVEEAAFLRDEEAGWVEFATAVFLHAVERRVAKGTPPGSAWELFNDVVCMEKMGPVFLTPQGIGAAKAREIISAIQ